MEDKITSVMREKRTFFPPEQLSRRAYIKSPEEYDRIYDESIKDPEKFWSAQARENLDWFESTKTNPFHTHISEIGSIINIGWSRDYSNL